MDEPAKLSFRVSAGKAAGIVPMFCGSVAGMLTAGIRDEWHTYHQKQHRFDPGGSHSHPLALCAVWLIAALIIHLPVWLLYRGVTRDPVPAHFGKLGWRVLFASCYLVGFAMSVIMFMTNWLPVWQ